MCMPAFHIAKHYFTHKVPLTNPEIYFAENKKHCLRSAFCFLEVTPGFEPGNEGFADLCLTAWPRHHIQLNIRNAGAFLIFAILERVTRLELATSTLARWRSTG